MRWKLFGNWTKAKSVFKFILVKSFFHLKNTFHLIHLKLKTDYVSRRKLNSRTQLCVSVHVHVHCRHNNDSIWCGYVGELFERIFSMPFYLFFVRPDSFRKWSQMKWAKYRWHEMLHVRKIQSHFSSEEKKTKNSYRLHSFMTLANFRNVQVHTPQWNMKVWRPKLWKIQKNNNNCNKNKWKRRRGSKIKSSDERERARGAIRKIEKEICLAACQNSRVQPRHFA